MILLLRVNDTLHSCARRIVKDLLLLRAVTDVLSKACS